MADTSNRSRGGALRAVVSVIVCVVLLAVAAGATWIIRSSEPEAEREAATRRTAALVETTVVDRGDHRPRLRVLGVVEPARDVVLSPRVAGQIVTVESALVPGAVVEANEPLLRIDPVDFERMVVMRESEVRQVEAELAIEQGRQAAARAEYELLGEEIPPENRSLVLREPQIATIRARLRAAEAALDQSRIDLERATVRAPFHAQVLERTATVGSQVTPGDDLARLVGVDEYWVIASLPLRDLRRVRFEGPGGPGSPVTIRHPAAWGPDEAREGRVARLIGTVDRESRLARVLVVVDDPLGRSSDAPPLILDTLVEVEIEARPLDDVVRIDRRLLRRDDTVWVMQDGELDIRRVTVAGRDAEHAYVAEGLEAGEHVVVTDLATVTDGLPLRREGGAEGDAVLADRDASGGAP